MVLYNYELYAAVPKDDIIRWAGAHIRLYIARAATMSLITKRRTISLI